MIGTVVATVPHRKTPIPKLCRPETNFGPAVRPMTAMKTFNPTEFMNQSAGLGMRPNVGRMARYQPAMMPMMSAPPAVESVIGTPPRSDHDRADQRADRDRDADEGDVGDVGWPVEDAERFSAPQSYPPCVPRA